MEKYTLQAATRTPVGRKVKKLRKEGKVPATVYGKKIPSVSVSVDAKTFALVYQKAGESSLVELSVDGSVRPVLIHTVQLDALTGYPLHIEFFQVDLHEKVRTNVPIVLTGEPAAVAQKVGALFAVLQEVEVEALPMDLPKEIIVDVTSLKDLNEEIKVEDIKAPKGVTVLTDAQLTVAKIGPLVSKEAAADEAAQEAASAAEKAENDAAATPATEATQSAPQQPQESSKE